MRPIALVIALALGLVVGSVADGSSAAAASGCRAFGQGLIAGHAQEVDERPGVGDEAVLFVPANDDVALFKTFVCG